MLHSKTPVGARFSAIKNGELKHHIKHAFLEEMILPNRDLDYLIHKGRLYRCYYDNEQIKAAGYRKGDWPAIGSFQILKNGKDVVIFRYYHQQDRG